MDAEAPRCRCFFCQSGKEHRHSSSFSDEQLWDVGARLLKAESLDPKDFQPTRTCRLCGHTEDRIKNEGGTR